MKRIVVGIDQSLSDTGVAIIAEDGWQLFTGVKVPHVPGSSGVSYEADRIRTMANRVFHWIVANLPCSDHVVPSSEEFRAAYDAWFIFEAPLPGGVGGKEDERGGVRWTLALALQRYGALGVINPQTVKSYWTGNGGVKRGEKAKDRMMAYTALRYPHLTMTDDNANDAYAIAHAAAEARGFDLGSAVPGVKHEALAAVRWPQFTPQRESKRA